MTKRPSSLSRSILVFTGALFLGLPLPGFGIAVYLNFDTDWQNHLVDVAADAGVAGFSAAERGTIESTIQAKLETIYHRYNVDFTTTVPGTGNYDILDFGANTASANTLGSAPHDFANTHASDTAKVYSENFGRYIDSGDARAQQIADVSTALAGTGGHELGHSLGLLHHHAYGTDGISPATYANTGGLQNNHVMATGSTGLNAAGRTTDRTFSQWSNLILESAGGLDPTYFGTTGAAIANTVLQMDVTDRAGTDAGDTTATAMAASTTYLPISELFGGYQYGNLSTAADVDVYSFDATAGSTLLAEAWSDRFVANPFDSFLRLYDTDGSTLLASNDDSFYSDNTFNGGTFRESNAVLNNIPLLNAGTYYLEVSNGAGSDSGYYGLVFGLDMAAVPEPSTTISLFVLVLVFHLHRRRRGA